VRSNLLRLSAVILSALLIAFVVLVVGRNDDIDPVPLPEVGESAMSYVGNVGTAEITEAGCALLNAGGSLAMALRIDFSNTDYDQGIFQTSDGETGVFIEFQRSEQHTLRLGVNTRDGFRRVYIARQTWLGERRLLIVIRSSGRISVVGEGISVEEQFSRVAIDCSRWTVGGGNDLPDFSGSVDISWGITANDDAFDSQVISYQRDLKSAASPGPRSGFLIMIAAVGLLLVAVFRPRMRNQRDG
jgi:hypothetical protein